MKIKLTKLYSPKRGYSHSCKKDDTNRIPTDGLWEAVGFEDLQKTPIVTIRCRMPGPDSTAEEERKIYEPVMRACFDAITITREPIEAV